MKIRCDFCNNEFAPSDGGQLLPIMLYDGKAPRGVYACPACYAPEIEEALVEQWFTEHAEEIVIRDDAPQPRRRRAAPRAGVRGRSLWGGAA